MFGDLELTEMAYNMRVTVFGKSVQGASHIRSGTECQDSYRKLILSDKDVILAVADGHGSKSCPYSKAGSKIAVNVFCDIVAGLYKSYDGNDDQLQTFLNREGDTSVSKSIDTEWKKRVIDCHKRHKREIGLLKNGEADLASVYKQYGSTLLGILITETFVFAFQLGDGDICYADGTGLDPVIEPDKILGIETHSLSSPTAWQKAITTVHKTDINKTAPAIFTLSTDGYANSFKCEEDFYQAIKDYLSMIIEHGVKAVSENLGDWLSETSELGCGDDITLLIAFWG